MYDVKHQIECEYLLIEIAEDTTRTVVNEEIIMEWKSLIIYNYIINSLIHDEIINERCCLVVEDEIINKVVIEEINMEWKSLVTFDYLLDDIIRYEIILERKCNIMVESILINFIQEEIMIEWKSTVAFQYLITELIEEETLLEWKALNIFDLLLHEILEVECMNEYYCIASLDTIIFEEIHDEIKIQCISIITFELFFNEIIDIDSYNIFDEQYNEEIAIDQICQELCHTTTMEMITKQFIIERELGWVLFTILYDVIHEIIIIEINQRLFMNAEEFRLRPLRIANENKSRLEKLKLQLKLEAKDIQNDFKSMGNRRKVVYLECQKVITSKVKEELLLLSPPFTAGNVTLPTAVYTSHSFFHNNDNNSSGINSNSIISKQQQQHAYPDDLYPSYDGTSIIELSHTTGHSLPSLISSSLSPSSSSSSVLKAQSLSIKSFTDTNHNINQSSYQSSNQSINQSIKNHSVVPNSASSAYKRKKTIIRSAGALKVNVTSDNDNTTSVSPPTSSSSSSSLPITLLNHSKEIDDDNNNMLKIASSNSNYDNQGQHYQNQVDIDTVDDNSSVESNERLGSSSSFRIPSSMMSLSSTSSSSASFRSKLVIIKPTDISPERLTLRQLKSDITSTPSSNDKATTPLPSSSSLPSLSSSHNSYKR